MYKCGWNGCEKAYGTLNHLNAHVTMQSHGLKRTPEGQCCGCLFLHILNKNHNRNRMITLLATGEIADMNVLPRIQGNSQGVEGT